MTPRQALGLRVTLGSSITAVSMETILFAGGLTDEVLGFNLDAVDQGWLDLLEQKIWEDLRRCVIVHET